MGDSPDAPVAEGLDPARAAWYEERERDLVASEVSLIRVYQYKIPDAVGPYRDYSAPWPNTWWEEFWRSLERHVEKRRSFERLYRERHQPGGRQADLTGYLEMDPSICPYKPHGQQRLTDFTGGQADA